MAYTDFTLEAVTDKFSLTLHQGTLFPTILVVPVPPELTQRLAEGAPFAQRSEKARSEFIVAPVLLSVVRRAEGRISIYSGQRFDVDPASGLIGECDFILSATEPLPIVRAPIVSVIEAKKADLELGYGQCAAQMLGSLRFNQRQPNHKPFVYGCVTTGEVWQFLRLESQSLTFDTMRYDFNHIGTLLSAFSEVIRQSLP